MRIGLIGYGYWGKNLAKNISLLKDAKLSAICDTNAQALNHASEHYPQATITKQHDDLLKDSNIDALIISTPPKTHYEIAKSALLNGKHVLVEKPFALNLRDGENMIKLAKSKKRILMVGHILLYHPAISMLKGYINKGELGNIYYIYSTRVNLGKVRKDENALWSLTAHDISVVTFLLGREPIYVSAKGESYLRDGVHDVVFLSLGFKDKVMVHIHASWLDPHKIRKFTIVGSKKMAVFDDMESTQKIRIYDKGFDWHKNDGGYETFLTPREGDIFIPNINMIEPLKLECQHFVDCIKKNRSPISDGENGLKVLKVLVAAQKSMETDGRVIKI